MNKRGIALILVFFVIMVLAILGAAIVSRGMSEANISRRDLDSRQSFWLAEAGAQSALYALNYNDWTGWDTVSPQVRHKTEALGVGSYDVTVSDISGNNPRINVNGNALYSQRDIEVKLAKEAQSPFTYAAFAKTSITMSGNGKTDSYNSSLGAYGGTNKGSDGDIGTNGITSGAITLSGNATVNGDVGTGQNGTVQLNGNAKVTGTTTHDIAKDLTAVTVPTGLTGLTSNGAYSLSGNSSATLSAGSYKYTSLDISGNAQLTINGEANIYITSTSSAMNISGNGKIILAAGAKLTVYVDGRCNIGGNGIANNTTIPANFMLYSNYSGTGDGVQVSGNGDLKGAIYAPETTVKVSGNGNVYGSLVGKDVAITGNGYIHFDQALKSVSVGSSHYAVAAWKDDNSPYPLVSQ